MATLHWRGSTLLGPVPPAMVTVKDPAQKSGGNIITVAWTGIINTHPPKAYISVRPQRYSYRLLCDTRECIIHLTTRALVQAADFAACTQAPKWTNLCAVISPRYLPKRLMYHASRSARSRWNAASRTFIRLAAMI